MLCRSIAGIAVVDAEDDVMIITNDGIIIRTAVGDIRECGRSSQGVIVMRTGEDVKVISIARTDKEESEAEADSAVADDNDTETAAESESPDGAVSEEAGAVSDDTAQSEGSAE